MFEGGKLIYGQDVIKENNFLLDKREIGTLDLLVLYWTRMWTFLGSWEGEFHELNIEDSRFFQNQMAKAILAACDMRLVKMKKYTTSYIERVNILKREFSDDSNFCELLSWALNEKLRPTSDTLKKQDMENLYFSAKDVFLKSFEYAMEADAQYFLNPDKTKKYYLFHTKIYLMHIYGLLRYHHSCVTRQYDVFYAMNYVLHANDRGNINKTFLTKASTLLQKHRYLKQPSYSWNDLRLLTANARNNI